MYWSSTLDMHPQQASTITFQAILLPNAVSWLCMWVASGVVAIGSRHQVCTQLLLLGILHVHCIRHTMRLQLELAGPSPAPFSTNAPLSTHAPLPTFCPVCPRNTSERSCSSSRGPCGSLMQCPPPPCSAGGPVGIPNLPSVGWMPCQTSRCCNWRRPKCRWVLLLTMCFCWWSWWCWWYPYCTVFLAITTSCEDHPLYAHRDTRSLRSFTERAPCCFAH